MTSLITITNLACLPVACVLFLITCASAQKFGEAKLVFERTWLEFDWPSESDKQESTDNGSYVPERSVLAGIKIYNDDVFLTIPRWVWTSGHPVTLAKVVTIQGQTKLRPYPSWAAQKQGDCNALQYVQSMEIDPNTGHMYVIDTGLIGSALSLCPAKIIVYDLNTDKELDRYEFPDEIANRSKCFLNDIVLDYIDGQVRYAYITNPREQRIVVYNFQNRSAHFLEDSTMHLEGNNGSVISINGKDHIFLVDIDGIAMSYDFQYVYFCALGGYNLYQVPTSVLRSNSPSGNNSVRLVGRKVSQSDGMAHGNKHLFYSALGPSAIYYWDSDKDMAAQKVGMDKVNLATQVELARDNVSMQWPDTFGFDERGWIWVVANRLQDFMGSEGIPAGQEPFMRVWKVYVDETSYLYQADKRTLERNGGSAVRLYVTFSGCGSCLAMILPLVTIWVCHKVIAM